MPRPRLRTPWFVPRRLRIRLIIGGVLGVAAVGAWLTNASPLDRLRGCNVKGNISASGERIYHVPGGRWYEATRINPRRGERWFCSEAEARAAGWRRSLR